MAEPKVRTIQGLPPRAPQVDVSTLLAANRPAAAQPSPAAPVSEATPAAAAPGAPPAAKAERRAARSPQRRPAAVGSQADTTKSRVAAYFTEENRDRARAAFRATAHVEGDDSFSDFIERAVMAEVERRELDHNDGKPFVASGGNLRPGRPLGN